MLKPAASGENGLGDNDTFNWHSYMPSSSMKIWGNAKFTSCISDLCHTLCTELKELRTATPPTIALPGWDAVI